MNRQGSATEAVGQALGHVKTVLMQPFDMARWVMLGFIAWLAYLGDGGYAFNFRNPFGQDDRAIEGVRDVVTWMLAHKLAAGLILFFLFLFVLILGVLMQWLSSRGTFVYIDCLATNRAELARPWREHGELADSYFFWRLVFGLCTSLVVFVLLLPLLVTVVSLLASGEELSPGSILFGSALVFASMPVLILVVLFAGLVRLTLRDFVAPVQYLRRIRCGQAMRIVLGVIRSSPGAFFVYLLLKIGIAIVVALGVFVIGCATCCVGFCCIALPVIGQVLLQPVYVFDRSFPLFFLAGFGADFDVFGPGAPGGGLPVPPPPPPLTPPPAPPWATTPWSSERGPSTRSEPETPRREPPPAPPESVPLSDWPETPRGQPGSGSVPAEPPSPAEAPAPEPPPPEPPPPAPPKDPEEDGGPR